MDLYLNDILSDQNRKVLEDLFENLLTRNWKVKHKDLTFAEETIRILSYSFDEEIKNKREELRNLVKEVLQKVFLATDTKFNPLAVLLSETNLYLCEISKASTNDENRFSLLGIFAKRHDCTDTFLVGRISSGFMFFKNHHTMVTIMIDHISGTELSEFRDFFIHENGTSLSEDIVEYHSSFINKIVNPVIINLKKPKTNIISTPAIFPN